tara:strand:- start:639 stop:1223 length:585 start_codon:yes stop_codon:yes gene_type:complete
MAKGKNDVILRDRLQFETTGAGNVSLVYGRIDLSDYVSIVKNEGLAIKEIRFQFRDPNSDEAWPTFMGSEDFAAYPANQVVQADICAFATTTAYESARDIGLASPNVICLFEKKSSANATAGFVTYEDHMFGTPDLHPDGYDVVTDLLIGVYGSNLQCTQLVDSTLELDVMIIAEPKKITSKDLTQMLSQAQDL